MRRHTTPDAYGSALLAQHLRALRRSGPEGPGAAALHARAADARALLAHAAGVHDVDDLIALAHAGGTLTVSVPGGDPWALGELARVIALQDLEAEDRPDGLALFDALLRTVGPRAVAPEHQGLHAQLALAAGRAGDLLETYPRIPRPVHEALTVDLAEPHAWLARFTALLPAPAFTIEPGDGPRFDRIRSGAVAKTGGPHRITTIVTTYRPGRELITTVASLIAQSWTNQEILVVDDGSGSDHTALLDEVAELDPRVRVLRMPINGGTYLARNAGLDAATGEFVTFQDSDDWSHPFRLERQVTPLLTEPTLFATTTAGMRATADLVITRPGFPQHRSYNLSSLMVRRGPAVDRLGYLDTVRKGADAEYVERARAVLGRAAVRHLGGAPLALIRLSGGSLSSADMAPGWMHPARHAYLSAFQAWHARVAAGRERAWRPRYPQRRAFAAPRRLAGDAAVRSAAYDVILAGDWTDGGADRIRAVGARGVPLALLHLGALTTGPRNLDPDVQQLVNTGAVEQVVLADEVHARLLVVRDPAVLAFAPTLPSGIRADRVVIEGGASWARAADVCSAAAERLFGTAPSWAPAGPAGRAALAALDLRLTPADLPGTVDLRRWGAERVAPRSDRPVVGRIVTDGREELRRLRSLLRDSGDFDVRLLDRTGETGATFGSRPPLSWLIYQDPDVTPRGFLHQIDFYLHLGPDDAPPDPDPEMLTALAAGCVLLLPHRYEPTFGPAAVYCAPEELRAVLRRLHRHPERFRAQSTRGRELVRHAHHHDHYAKAITELLAEQPQPARG
ncbi:glycosyltransferase [Actinoplanes sp. NPDC051851]|uniref:glycosyltransferase n=1 Tax=Actinoplanes sp. NPDC051851 TaxID=3154753 RepID=UPI0034474450